MAKTFERQNSSSKFSDRTNNSDLWRIHDIFFDGASTIGGVRAIKTALINPLSFLIEVDLLLFLL